YWKQPYHTSALTGAQWVQELIAGHPDCIYTELGMMLHVFLLLIHELQVTCGLEPSHHLGVEEMVDIFLNMSVTGLSVHHVGECFQHSNETISKYFVNILDMLASPAFYSKYVKLPTTTDPVPPFILNNPKFYPFVK
ncbi:hypothetical protein AMATHDRAFT_114474, partial [Amanita thiersii Skay4041]